MQKGHKKKKKRPSGRESPASSVGDLISALVFGIPYKISLYALQNNPILGARWCSQQYQSNLIATLSPSLQAFVDAISQQEVALTLKNLGSSSRSARDRGGEPANHSEAAAFVRPKASVGTLEEYLGSAVQLPPISGADLLRSNKSQVRDSLAGVCCPVTNMTTTMTHQKTSHNYHHSLMTGRTSYVCSEA
ncbi:hypothetical protein E2C01_043287 [Portunus trituberculatus]|uniref:Uncharacterized protein n=1 Tax=Portunus trituberculatus TaxID=210409 RepID=A0A5B7FVX0_PORTR|nr:hypothetical protein [Portunus trituberculatus]